MDPVAAQLIGAGLACLGIGLAAIGVGNIFGNYIGGAMRNPSAAEAQFTRAIVGVAFAEALGLFAFVLGILLLFR